MSTTAAIPRGPRLLFTAPWEPVVVRRGDALGLRGLADLFADAVAPGLSNRVRDGRWVTILAWCLTRSHEVFHASGGQSVATRAQQRERYAWLRPLELMWVARTIALADDWQDRSLSGQRRVRPWYEDDEQSVDRFGMSVDQFRAYRQTGMYGGYRVAFRAWPGLTASGDGWTPGPATQRLASWLDERLAKARPTWPLHAGSDDEALSTRSVKLARGDEARWWLRNWDTFDEGGRRADASTLPRRWDEFETLPEAALLRRLVFGSDPSGQRRLRVAGEVAESDATDHIGVCDRLASVFASDRVVALLPAFSRLADAGIAVMDFVADALRGDSSVPLSEVVARPHAPGLFANLFQAARQWRAGAVMSIRHIETANRFAGAFTSADPGECVRALLHYHEVLGGGLRWFVLRDGRVEPRTPPRGTASRYRFRLWSLCRLAAQCGVLAEMPQAVLHDDEVEEVETSENADE